MFHFISSISYFLLVMFLVIFLQFLILLLLLHYRHFLWILLNFFCFTFFFLNILAPWQAKNASFYTLYTSWTQSSFTENFYSLRAYLTALSVVTWQWVINWKGVKRSNGDEPDVLFRHYPSVTEENREKHTQNERFVGRDLNPGIFRTRSTKTNHTNADPGLKPIQMIKTKVNKPQNEGEGEIFKLFFCHSLLWPTSSSKNNFIKSFSTSQSRRLWNTNRYLDPIRFYELPPR
jgi:hypothetical protein